MEIQEVQFIIDTEGRVSFEVSGVKGRRCLDITRDLELDLGGEVLSREETSEMYEEEAQEKLRRRITTQE
ncbi:MAG: hypothetical protein C4B57_02230 [Deltaproteobacteria bacterium]|nr:MAG: hypothetical protein C4B57_02230 [Deltaproteobacteria bacterium]RKX58720.1 MAG: hypothetical protein DRP28_04400 [Thermodesulfobacteriota bacterium]RLB92856.1 MAG: hypothetical protein DRH50_08950 [Deltaproteobacteria bacterium]HDZ89250.1 DUF2997 domain-containing protein [Deltaproteobacteria bacterium]